MEKYAILNKQTNSVTNTIVIEDEKFISTIIGENEYAVPASRSVQIGMVYDKKTGTFPEVHLKDQILDLKEIINLKIVYQNSKISENLHLSTEDLSDQFDYVDKLNQILTLEDYDLMKSEFESLPDPPAIPDPPKEISQDLFRSCLNLTEKILWDNAETGTEIQKALINTLKVEFPYYGIESMEEMFTMLEQNQVLSNERIIEIKTILEN